MFRVYKKRKLETARSLGGERDLKSAKEREKEREKRKGKKRVMKNQSDECIKSRNV